MLYPRNAGTRPIGYQKRLDPDESVAIAGHDRIHVPTAAPADDATCPAISNQPLSLAMAYVPFQVFDGLYEPERALCTGTLFQALDKPFYGQRGRT